MVFYLASTDPKQEDLGTKYLNKTWNTIKITQTTTIQTDEDNYLFLLQCYLTKTKEAPNNRKYSKLLIIS